MYDERDGIIENDGTGAEGVPADKAEGITAPQTEDRANTESPYGTRSAQASQNPYGGVYGNQGGTYGQAPYNAQPPRGTATPPPQNRYTYYSDGSYRYSTPASPSAGYGAQGASGGKSKATVVLAVLVAVLFVGVLALGAYILLGDDRENGGDGRLPAVLDGDSTAESLGGEAKDESIFESVPEIVTVAPVPDESYDSLVELYNKCSPSCVSIICTVEYNGGFFGVQVGKSLGSGFIVEGKDPKSGKMQSYIITNHHVIDGAKSITVRFYDDSEYDATLIGSDEMTDIAVLSIDKKDMIPLEIGDSDELNVGEWVVAIGTPSDEELAGTMSYGIVSGVDRDIQITNDYGTVIKTMTVIQTTATLNPGNSGGPLINMAGQVVGINAMKLAEDFEGIGFALPSTSAMTIINSLIAYGEVVDRNDSFAVGAAKLGIQGGTVTDAVREEYRLSDDCPDGVLVTTVNRGTAVYEAGLSAYDIITAFDGVEITTIEQLQEALTKAGAGKTVEMTFYRMGRKGETGAYHTIRFVLDSAS